MERNQGRILNNNTSNKISTHNGLINERTLLKTSGRYSIIKNPELDNHNYSQTMLFFENYSIHSHIHSLFMKE
jgi:hypothetical protein